MSQNSKRNSSSHAINKIVSDIQSHHRRDKMISLLMIEKHLNLLKLIKMKEVQYPELEWCVNQLNYIKSEVEKFNNNKKKVVLKYDSFSQDRQWLDFDKVNDVHSVKVCDYDTENDTSISLTNQNFDTVNDTLPTVTEGIDRINLDDELRLPAFLDVTIDSDTTASDLGEEPTEEASSSNLKLPNNLPDILSSPVFQGNTDSDVTASDLDEASPDCSSKQQNSLQEIEIRLCETHEQIRQFKMKFFDYLSSLRQEDIHSADTEGEVTHFMEKESLKEEIEAYIANETSN